MEDTVVQQSIWQREEDNDERAPKYCPHCGEAMAHPDNLRENDEIDAVGRASAYREHRKAHFGWGTDPAELYRDGDPYLADYYDGISTSDTGPTLDLDEDVAGVYDVTIHYEAVMRARVVASDDHAAKDRVTELRRTGKDLSGHVPKPEVTHKVHDEVREVKKLTRKDIKDTEDVDEEEDGGVNYAERLAGWPW